MRYLIRESICKKFDWSKSTSYYELNTFRYSNHNYFCFISYNARLYSPMDLPITSVIAPKFQYQYVAIPTIDLNHTSIYMSAEKTGRLKTDTFERMFYTSRPTYDKRIGQHANMMRSFVVVFKHLI